MKIITLEETKQKETPFKLDAKVFWSAKDADAIRLTVEPGKTIPPHKSPMPVLFYILEGEGKTIGGSEEVKIRKDTLLHSEVDELHGFENTGETPLRLLVIKLKGCLS